MKRMSFFVSYPDNWLGYTGTFIMLAQKLKECKNSMVEAMYPAVGLFSQCPEGGYIGGWIVMKENVSQAQITELKKSLHEKGLITFEDLYSETQLICEAELTQNLQISVAEWLAFAKAESNKHGIFISGIVTEQAGTLKLLAATQKHIRDFAGWKWTAENIFYKIDARNLQFFDSSCSVI